MSGSPPSAIQSAKSRYFIWLIPASADIRSVGTNGKLAQRVTYKNQCALSLCSYFWIVFCWNLSYKISLKPRNHAKKYTILDEITVHNTESIMSTKGEKTADPASISTVLGKSVRPRIEKTNKKISTEKLGKIRKAFSKNSWLKYCGYNKYASQTIHKIALQVSAIIFLFLCIDKSCDSYNWN